MNSDMSQKLQKFVTSPLFQICFCEDYWILVNWYAFKKVHHRESRKWNILMFSVDKDFRKKRLNPVLDFFHALKLLMRRRISCFVEASLLPCIIQTGEITAVRRPTGILFESLSTLIVFKCSQTLAYTLLNFRWRKPHNF